MTCLLSGDTMTSPRAGPVFLFCPFPISSHEESQGLFWWPHSAVTEETLPGPHTPHPHPLPRFQLNLQAPRKPLLSLRVGECLLCFNFLSS